MQRLPNHRTGPRGWAPTEVSSPPYIGYANRLSPWGQAAVDADPEYQKERRRVDLILESRFRRPVAVNVDDQGRIMVLETQRGRTQIYTKDKDFVDASLNL